MISKIGKVVSDGKYTPKIKAVRSFVKTEYGLLSEKANRTQQKLKTTNSVLFNKIKNVFNSVNKYFTEEFRSKNAGIKPLKGKELEKHIRETSIYDPNSPDYIHGNYCVDTRKKTTKK